jgi:hypothetical protein
VNFYYQNSAEDREWPRSQIASLKMIVYQLIFKRLGKIPGHANRFDKPLQVRTGTRLESEATE